MFSGICAVVPPELVRRRHTDFLKEKGQITRPPQIFFLFFTLKPQMFSS